MIRSVLGGFFALMVLGWGVTARLNRHRSYTVPASSTQTSDDANASSGSGSPALVWVDSNGTVHSIDSNDLRAEADRREVMRRRRGDVSFEPGQPMVDVSGRRPVPGT